jgi:hypothetical protein
VTQLSHLSTLGIAKETTPNTYQSPVIAVPFTKGDFEDVTESIKDESIRGNDTTLQGLYPGVQQATWSIDVLAYPLLTGHWLRGIIGPDTVTAGVSTTLSTSSTAGANSIQTTASITAGSTIQIQDTGGANTEYAVTGSPSGAGPYTIPLTSTSNPNGGTTLQYAHTAPTCTVISQSTHLFKQSPGQTWPTYSLTVYDTLQYLGYVGAKMSQLQVKIDPKAGVSLTADLTAFPGAVQTTVSETYTQDQPMLGWEWTQTQAGTASTRGLTLDLTIKRAVEALHTSNGVQIPREIFAGTLDCDGTFKAIFENQLDLNLFAQWSQQPLVASLAQPIAFGGNKLSFTMSKSGWYKGKRDLGQGYVQADYSISGIYNSTDGGAVQATLNNFQSTSY